LHLHRFLNRQKAKNKELFISELRELHEEPIKITVDKMDLDKIFLTGDLHLNHTNIITYCNRPFNSVKKMNKVLIPQ
jgi:hypothetical protein